jgi:hypothetical protein
MQSLTPASADDLPPLDELIADDPFWRHPTGTPAREGIAHLRVWSTVTTPPGHLAVVTETSLAASVTTAAGYIWAELARRYGPLLVLLEHTRRQAPQESEHLDLVRIGPDGQPRWTRVWPTGDDNPRHAGLQAWITAYGHQIVNLAANDAGWYHDEDI